MQILRSIQNRIYEIRGEKILLDFDIAALYEVETRVLNQAVKRNIKRFPKDFMFQLTREEFDNLKPSIVTSNLTSQIVMSSEWGGKRRMPYAFTEQGVALLSGVLNSEKAINMHIAIMRAFVEIRRVLLQQGDIKEQLRQIQERINDHDIQLSSIYEAIENLLDDTIAKKKWEERERIGFKK